MISTLNMILNIFSDLELVFDKFVFDKKRYFSWYKN